MTKGSSPLAKLRDLKRLLKKKASSLTSEQKEDLAKRIEQVQAKIAKPKEKSKSVVKSKKESKRSDGLKNEVFTLRAKLFGMKKDLGAGKKHSQEDIDALSQKLADKQRALEQQERCRREQQEKDWQAERKKRRQKAGKQRKADPQNESTEETNEDADKDMRRKKEEAEAAGEASNTKGSNNTILSNEEDVPQHDEPFRGDNAVGLEDGEVEGPSISSFFEIVTEGGEVELGVEESPPLARVERKEKRSFNQLQRRRYFDAAVPVVVPADGPLNRRQRRALARGDAKPEEAWEDRRDPTTSVAFDPRIKGEKKVFELSD